MSDPEAISFILPARNEAAALRIFLPELESAYPQHEIIVVDDGSEDDTVAVCKQTGVKCVSHPYPKGNGAALKTGARVARGDIFVFLDADGQHSVDSVKSLLNIYHEAEVDMVVGSRSVSGQASWFRAFGNFLYNAFASYIVGHKVKDLTSGCRVINAQYYRQFIHLLPNGFSAPSTITLAFFRSGLSVVYHPIEVSARIGRSHLRPIKDGLRFFIILYKLTILYSPLKVFLPIAFLHVLLGFIWWALRYNFTESLPHLSGVLFVAGVLVFLIGLVSEQITVLLYQPRKPR
ncbi:MAG: glycosyl transferase [Legionellales bacterium]|nr:glycosyl transferase [Legionellales bacterium]|tara:strand:+ start:833 stop:1705 length:873 start_codon:yes stop_codon:yes gene_type:complete